MDMASGGTVSARIKYKWALRINGIVYQPFITLRVPTEIRTSFARFFEDSGGGSKR